MPGVSNSLTRAGGVKAWPAFRDWFEQRLISYYHTLFVIEGQGGPRGFVYSYDVSVNDRFGFLTAFVDVPYRGTGDGARAALLCLDHLFAVHDLRKVYCDVFDYNDASRRALESGGFRLEGTFPAHRYFRGAHHAMHRLAIYREDFNLLHGTLVARLAGRARPGTAVVGP